jgi:hypothetical protein
MGAIAFHLPNRCPFTISIDFFTPFGWRHNFQPTADATVRAKGSDIVCHDTSDVVTLKQKSKVTHSKVKTVVLTFDF